jgi:hypothetical protein
MIVFGRIPDRYGSAMILDSADFAALKEKHFNICPSENKLSLIITGCHEDAAAKATLYTVAGTLRDPSGQEKNIEARYRYSQLYDFNETLIHEYGAIRILRYFPPKKLIGNKAGDFVAQRRDGLQTWMSEIVEVVELCEAPIILKFFTLAA